MPRQTVAGMHDCPEHADQPAEIGSEVSARPFTRTSRATPTATARPRSRSKDLSIARTRACQPGGTLPDRAYGTPGTTARTSSPRPSSTSRHPIRCVLLRIALRRRTRSRPGFESSPCSFHPVLDLCAAALSEGRCAPVAEAYVPRSHGQGTLLNFFQ